MMIIKKRGAVFTVVGLMLCVAIYLNWSYTKNNQDLSVASDIESGKILGESTLVDSAADETVPPDSITSVQPQESAYFSEARLLRQQSRDQALSILRDSTSTDTKDPKAVSTINDQIAVIAENTVKESQIESLIKAKGFKDCIVFINDNSVSVIVQKATPGLTAEDAAIIRDIVLDNVPSCEIKLSETE